MQTIQARPTHPPKHSNYIVIRACYEVWREERGCIYIERVCVWWLTNIINLSMRIKILRNPDLSHWYIYIVTFTKINMTNCGVMLAFGIWEWGGFFIYEAGPRAWRRSTSRGRNWQRLARYQKLSVQKQFDLDFCIISIKFTCRICSFKLKISINNNKNITINIILS